MKNKPLISLIFNFLNSISIATLGAFILSWPLLALFIVIQKTNILVNQPLGTIMHNYTQLLEYLICPFIKKLNMSNFPTSSSAAEHFFECKSLFELALIMFIIGLIIYFYLKRRKKLNYISLTKFEALFFMILPIIVLPFALMNFDSFFITFHHLLFNNSNWLFNPETDPIINVLSEGFFAACFAVAGIIYELYYASFILRK
ncbi:MAG: TIGR01906 family membrane protein [Lactobacillus sp.]|nr:TIGR01906 family membrane protein [Lactobacillus sp.]